MMNFILRCKYCDSALRVRGDYLYMSCMCNEDIRSISIGEIMSYENKFKYLILKKGIYYAPMEIPN